MILYREKTQIRLCINITDTGKHETNVTFLEYIIASHIIEILIKLKNVQLRDHSIIIAAVNTGVIFLILFL